ncbi:MAG TPA: hypothetical protein VF392_01670 [Terracidiphilus sp.]
MKTCAGMESQLAEMLLDEQNAPAKVRTHVTGCSDCQRELETLRATMALMDSWTAPEPNPYFMTRFEARLEAEQQAPPAGWLARLRDRWTYGSHLHARPVAAMALTVLMLLGGGTYLGVTNWEQPKQASHEAAVVNDLQTLDNNAQLLDQLEQISDTDNDSVVN